MKTLLVTLLLGLSCADLTTVDVSTLAGEWKTIYMTSTNPEKLSETGTFRAFLRKLEFDVEHDTITFDFFVKVNGECVEYFVKGPKVQDNRYTTDYAGRNDVQILYASQNSLIISFDNVDENGSLTTLIGIFGKGNDASEEDFETFKGLNRGLNIPEESMVDIISSDTCPTS